MFNYRGNCNYDGLLVMCYRTPNEESHVCIYCDTTVEGGQGVLLKYFPAQSDESIIISHLSDRVGHEKCVKQHGSLQDQEALLPFR